MLEVIYGTMRSGKSLEALVLAHNIEQHGRPVLMLTYAPKKSRQMKEISTRLGLKRSCIGFDESTLLTGLVAEHQDPANFEDQTLIVDEAQFLTEDQVLELHRISVAHRVVCYGLRVAADGKPFPGMAFLLGLCDKMRELEAICACSQHQKATMHIAHAGGVRIQNPERIRLGDSGYDPVCPRCFYAE